MKNSIHEVLVGLSNKVIERTKVYQDRDILIKVPYQRISTKRINYKDNTVQYDFDSIETFDVYEWESKDSGAFIRTEVLMLPEYEKAAAALATTFNFDQEGARIGLETLARYFMAKSTSNTFTIEHVTRYVDKFIEEYERGFKTLTWTIELWLANIYMESDEVEIAPNVFLKRATPQQLQYIGQHVHYFSEFDRIGSKVVPATVILSFPINLEWTIAFATDHETINAEIEQWLNVLRLFKPGNVYVTRQTSKPHTLFEYTLSEQKELPADKFWQGKVSQQDTSEYRLVISNQEKTTLASFSSLVKPLLKQISPMSYLMGSHLDLALHRYNDALLKSEVTAYKILSAVTSLEALLSDGSPEITYKIRLRTASLLRLFGFNAVDVYTNIGKAYNLRSKLVHGSSPKKSDLVEFARRYGYEIINYNRICFLAFLQLPPATSKEQLVAKLDCSLIDDKVKADLAGLMKNVQI